MHTGERKLKGLKLKGAKIEGRRNLKGLRYGFLLHFHLASGGSFRPLRGSSVLPLDVTTSLY